MTISNGQTREWTGEVIKVSNSEMRTWKECHRKWWFGYYGEWGLKRDKQETSGARSLGSRVHLAIEGLYTNDEDKNNPMQILKEIYDHDAEVMREMGKHPDAIVALWKEYDLAYAMVEGFLQWMQDTGIDDGYEVVAVESVIEVDSHIPGIKLRGKLDQRVVRTVDGARLFRDWKTVGDLKNPPMLLPLDEQMKFYMLLEFLESIRETGAGPQWRTDGGLYTMLRKVKRTASAKPPFYDQVEVQHNMETIRNMWTRVSKVVEELYDARVALDAGADHHYIAYPNPSRDCTWKCDFFSVCSMADDGSDLDGILNSFYEKADPHERYRAAESKEEGGLL